MVNCFKVYSVKGNKTTTGKMLTGGPVLILFNEPPTEIDSEQLNASSSDFGGNVYLLGQLHLKEAHKCERGYRVEFWGGSKAIISEVNVGEN